MRAFKSHAVSISRAVADKVRAPGFHARVLHAFPRAVNLVTEDGTVVTLADPTVGDGPLNVVAPASFDRVPANAIAWGDGRGLHVNGLAVALDRAAVWEPRWDWERRRGAESGERRAESEQWPAWPAGLYGVMAQAASAAIANLRAALQADDRRKLTAAAAALAGLGPGLTPAGDDFLAGVMWGLRFQPRDQDVDALCAAIVADAAPRTTPLSAALLRAAGAGLASAPWHALFDALDRGEDATEAIQAVLARGATSGADAWAGFQFAATVDSADMW